MGCFAWAGGRAWSSPVLGAGGGGGRGRGTGRRPAPPPPPTPPRPAGGGPGAGYGLGPAARRTGPAVVRQGTGGVPGEPVGQPGQVARPDREAFGKLPPPDLARGDQTVERQLAGRRGGSGAGSRRGRGTWKMM